MGRFGQMGFCYYSNEPSSHCLTFIADLVKICHQLKMEACYYSFDGALKPTMVLQATQNCLRVGIVYFHLMKAGNLSTYLSPQTSHQLPFHRLHHLHCSCHKTADHHHWNTCQCLFYHLMQGIVGNPWYFAYDRDGLWSRWSLFCCIVADLSTDAKPISNFQRHSNAYYSKD